MKDISLSHNRKVKSSHSSCTAASTSVFKSNFGLTTCSITLFPLQIFFTASLLSFHDEIPPAASDLLPASLGESFEDQVDQVVIALCADQIFTARAPKLLVALGFVRCVHREHTVCCTPNALASAWCTTPAALLHLLLALVAVVPRHPQDALLDGPAAGATVG